MEIFTGDELRLTYALLLAGAALAGSWRFVSRRVGTDWADRAVDAGLLFLLVQYLAVGVPGVLAVLNPFTIAVCTLAISAGLLFMPRRGPTKPQAEESDTALDRWVLVGCTVFLVGYVVSIIVVYRLPPITANDPLTYHAPAAVRWLQTGRLGLLETWFFNPANTYSPLAGSTFLAWWMAPVGNDVLARTVQDPPLILAFFAAVRLMRGMGVRTAVAAVIALAVVQSQPLIRQSIIEKDDVAVAAFFACAVAGCATERTRDPLGPWRIGIALGLLLATKYTALMALPILLLLVDAPFRARWRWREWAIAVGAPLLLAGPWYLRNAMLTGNPVFPLDVKVAGVTVFTGLFATTRSAQLRSIESVWQVLTRRDQSLPVMPFVIVAIGFVASVLAAVRGRRLLREPLVRVCAVGPVVGLLLFLATSPYAEVRFLYPVLVLAYAACGLAIAGCVRNPLAQLAAAAVVYVPSAATGFKFETAELVAELGGGAICFVIVGLALVWAWRQWPARRKSFLQYGGLAVVMLYAAAVYVLWPAHLKQCRESAPLMYHLSYGPVGDLWTYVRSEVPPDETLAYANTYLIHPLSGFEHRRRVLYVPTRRGVDHINDLPHLDGLQTGETLVKNVAAVTVAETDARRWLDQLFASGATHVVVFYREVVKDPPELQIVRANPLRFEQVFSNDAGVVYRLRR